MSGTFQQPWLHDAVLCVAAPTSVQSETSGQMRGTGVHGVLQSDRFTLRSAVLRLDGVEPEPLTHALDGTSGAAFVGIARSLGDPGPDPTVRVERRRRAEADGMTESISVVSTADTGVNTQLQLRVTTDGGYVEDVKAGAPPGENAVPAADSGELRWACADLDVRVSGVEAVASVEGDAGLLTWTVDLAPRASTTLIWSVRGSVPGGVTLPAPRQLLGAAPVVVADDVRLAAWVDRSIADLRALTVGTTAVPGEAFIAAGAPWYLALFGRDSLWTARMLLPLGTDVAESTLRVLAGLQGRRSDPANAEAPGKIIHELRAPRPGAREGERLPPRYYGTIDATMLWVALLHDAWRWGLAADRVEPLLGACVAALDWVAGEADADGDGFLEYEDPTGRGLSNQGWKDSYDAVRFGDGALAAAPIALCEVQAYACEALLRGATLLEAFGRPGTGRYRDRAAEIVAHFRRAFWVEDADGPYPAMALDRDKRPVDSVTSNIGHLLGTGLLDGEESELVARRLVSGGLDSGYGLRTMSTAAGGYAPLSYHCGSVWPHDTAIALLGLSRAGLGSHGAPLVEGLLRAAAAFDYRMPELYGGDGSAEWARPVPYPAACMPQAWTAASAVATMSALLGLDPDVGAGKLRVSPMRPSPVGALRIDGLSLAGDRFDVTIGRDGNVTDATVPPGVVLEVA